MRGEAGEVTAGADDGGLWSALTETSDIIAACSGRIRDHVKIAAIDI